MICVECGKRAAISDGYCSWCGLSASVLIREKEESREPDVACCDDRSVAVPMTPADGGKACRE